MMETGASFSEDRKHRFCLWRIWDASLPKVLCIGLNPSTANENKNDPTINILILALNVLGYGGVFMVNCYSLISSKPEVLKDEDINSPENTDNHYLIGDTAKKCDTIIFAWGDFKILRNAEIVKRWENLFPAAKCFGKNKSGTPFHPLALMYKGLVESPQLINYFTNP